MREIKFRAWDKIRKRFATHIEIYEDGTFNIGEVEDSHSGLVYWEEKDCELMQFIGKQDEKKVDIYEDDIFEITDGDGLVVGTHIACLDAETLSIDERAIGKIIGNIHENPELLNKIIR